MYCGKLIKQVVVASIKNEQWYCLCRW